MEVHAGGKIFAVPIEHLDSSPQNYLSPLTGSKEFLVRFSAAWLSAHIDGYQPILNKGFEGDVVRIVVGEQVKIDKARLHPPTVDLWYKRGTFDNRIIMNNIEPNTGFYIIQPIPYNSRPGYEGEQWHLAKTLPDESKPYPENPQWKPYLCNRTRGFIEEAKVFTKCRLSTYAGNSIFFDVDVSGENLQIHESILSVLANEITSWNIKKDVSGED